VRLAKYLSLMDNEGYAIVRSPHALRTQRNGDPLDSLGLVTLRGVGQGDVSSPLAWTALFDILLTALKTVDKGQVWSTTTDEERYLTPDIAYADDLISIQSTIEGLQAKADIVSAFTLLFGLQLATKKFRGFAVNWGNEYREMAKEVIIHGQGWTEAAVTLQGDGSLKHLGVFWDMDMTNYSQRQALMTRLRGALAHVTTRKASAGAKWMTIKTCIFPQVAYVAKFMPWSLQEFDALEQLVSQAIKVITKNRRDTAAALLYGPTSHAGLGFTSLTDVIHQQKLTIFRKMMLTTDRGAMLGMMGRVGDASGHTGVRGVHCEISKVEDASRCWARSLVEWMNRENYTLHHYGNARHKYISADDTISRAQGAELEAERWIEADAPDQRGSEHVTPLRKGQFWHREGGRMS
jgi:hypothetical protein